MNGKLAALGVAVIAAGFVLASSLYTVDQNEQALVLQFGQVVKAETTPGLKIKIPFIQDVRFFDRRVLDVDPPVQPLNLSGGQPLNVDSYVRYRIADSLLFLKSVGNEKGADIQISSLVNSTLRNVLGNYTQRDLLSEERGAIIRQVRDGASEGSKRWGIEIVDVRIVRTDLPAAILQSVYERMRTERDSIAKQYRAEGQEAKTTIESEANRERTVLLAEAERKAQELRGQGDAEAIKVQAAAYGADPQFFSFYRSLLAYQTAMGPGTTLVLSPKSDFFKYFNDVTGRGLVPAVTQATPPAANLPTPPAAAPAPVEPAPAAPAPGTSG